MIVSAGSNVWQQWSAYLNVCALNYLSSLIDVQIVNASIASGLVKNIPVGDPASYDPEKAVHLFTYDVSKSKEILDIPYRTTEETARDIVADFVAKGWLN